MGRSEGILERGRESEERKGKTHGANEPPPLLICIQTPNANSLLPYPMSENVQPTQTDILGLFADRGAGWASEGRGWVGRRAGRRGGVTAQPEKEGTGPILSVQSTRESASAGVSPRGDRKGVAWLSGRNLLRGRTLRNLERNARPPNPPTAPCLPHACPYSPQPSLESPEASSELILSLASLQTLRSTPCGTLNAPPASSSSCALLSSQHLQPSLPLNPSSSPTPLPAPGST